jgi:hypothetical protein
MPLSPDRKTILTLVLCAPLFGAGLVLPVNPPVTVHEWGTFTSVAEADGQSVPWVPLNEKSADLPCFVHRLGDGTFKYVARDLVRMETPVDYFYTDAPAKISVTVNFPGNVITEWYPKATMPSPFQGIAWKDLNLLPNTNPTLLTTKNPSRYFAARATEAVPVQAGDESEKMLFYRGVGNFKVPVAPVSEGNGIRVYNNGDEPIPVAILFENQSGRLGYRVVRNVKGDVEIYAPELNASPGDLRRELVADLVQAGLYQKEATAMLETWHDSWFEPGMRVIYLMPRAAVDRVLPMAITPAPQEKERVFVGRAEILSPWTEHTIRKAMETGDTKTLDTFGRFLPPFLAQILAKGGLTESPIATAYIDRLASQRDTGPAPCIQ